MNYSEVKETITINGVNYPIDDCVEILQIKNKKWYLKTDPSIGYDASSKKWDLLRRIKEKKLIPYIIDISGDGAPIIEYNYHTSFTVTVESHMETIEDSIPNINRKIQLNLDKLANLEAESKDPFISIHKKDFNAVILRSIKNYFIKPSINYSFLGHNISGIVINCTTIINNYLTLNNLTYNDIKENTDLLLTLCDAQYLQWFKSTQRDKIIESNIAATRNNIEILRERKAILENSQYIYSGNCYSYFSAKKLGFIKLTGSNKMFLVNNLSEKTLKDYAKIKKKTNSYSFSSVYNVGEGAYTTDIIKKFNAKNNPLRKITKNNLKLANLLKGLTFGIEFETTNGAVPQIALNELGLIPLRDGSISGHEYATSPLGLVENKTYNSTHKLAEDLHILNYICEELTEFCGINEKCSMHLHVGNTRTDKLFIIALYVMLYKLQDEMFDLVPTFKLDGPRYAGLNKNYCRKYSNLKLADSNLTILTDKDDFDNEVNVLYDRIFTLLSNGKHMGPKFNRKLKVHPMNKKWERSERYYWVNMVNTIFSNSQTVEFRLHNATLNKTKVINWLVISAAIIKYTEKNIMEILKNKVPFTLDSIISGYTTGFSSTKKNNPYGEEVYRYLSAYIHHRRMFMQELYHKKDILGHEDLHNDPTYKFEYENISCLID